MGAVLVALGALPNAIPGSGGLLRTADVFRRLCAAAVQLARFESAAPDSYLRPGFVLAASVLRAVTFPARPAACALNAVSAAFAGLRARLRRALW